MREIEKREEYLIAELEDRILDTVDSYVSKLSRPVSAIVSGGYDSGLLSAIANPGRAYRMRFPYGVAFDESRYADAVSKHLMLPISSIDVTPQNFSDNFKEAVLAYGKSTPHFSLVPLYILFKNLAHRGETEVLSGEGPDEYLGGYARQIIFDYFYNLYQEPELRKYHPMVDRYLGINHVDKVWGLSTKYAELMGYDRILAKEFLFTNYRKYPFQGVLGKMDMTLGHIEEMEQKLASHFGIRVHYPYINEKLAEFCYQLPDRLKIRNGVTKWAFKKIAMRYLPPELAGRDKLGGPVAPVNKFMGWEIEMGDFGKEKYLQAQREILGSVPGEIIDGESN